MSKETKEKSNVEQSNTAEEKKDNGKKNLKWIILTAIVVVVAVVTGIVTYTQSASYKAKQQLELGEKYLEDLDYEQAIASFQTAMEIDPDNEEIFTAIRGHMDEFYQQARLYGSQEEYASEREIAVFMLSIDENSWQAMAADAEASLGTKEVKKAKEFYEKAKESGADENEVESGLNLCEAILKLLELCMAEDWNGVAEFINSAEFDPIKAMLEKENSLNFTDDTTIVIEKNPDGSYVVRKDGQSGNGVLIVSATNTNSIYEGALEDNLPNGNGMLTIWNKNEGTAQANQYRGRFFDGKLNGTTSFTTFINNEEKTFNLQISEGVVSVYQIDENNNIWITSEQSDEGCAYIAEYVNGTGNVITDYTAGVPGCGGSDQKLSIGLLDTIPPVIVCNLQKSHFYTGRNPEMREIEATDNVDGDLTGKVTYESTKVKNSYGYMENNWYGLRVDYTVADSAGNAAQLTVIYDVEDFCGEWGFTVVSIK